MSKNPPRGHLDILPPIDVDDPNSGFREFAEGHYMKTLADGGRIFASKGDPGFTSEKEVLLRQELASKAGVTQRDINVACVI